MTIPEVTDAEDLISFSTASSDHEFNIVINVGATAVWLFQASADGTVIPLVVLATDGPTFALDEVVVSSAISSGDSYMNFTLDAKDVRFF
jgi:hypothetical protein